MKKRILIVLVVVILALLLGSCNIVLGFIFPNEFTIGGASYEISKLYILNYGTFDTTNHYLDLWLVSDGIVINSLGQGSGAGDLITFWTIDSTPTLGEGTFTFNADFAGPPGTLYGGGSYVGADYAAGDADGSYGVAGGVLTVARPRFGDDYILDFTGTTDTGASFTAHYRGPSAANYEVSNSAPVVNVR